MLLIGSLDNARYEEIFREYYSGDTIPGIQYRVCYAGGIRPEMLY